MAQPIVIEGIDLTLKTEISERDITHGAYVADADLQRIRTAFPDQFAQVAPNVKCRWFRKPASHDMTFIPDE